MNAESVKMVAFAIAASTTVTATAVPRTYAKVVVEARAQAVVESDECGAGAEKPIAPGSIAKQLLDQARREFSEGRYTNLP